MHHRASWHGGQQPSSSQLKGIVSIRGGKKAGGKIAAHNYGLADGKGCALPRRYNVGWPARALAHATWGELADGQVGKEDRKKRRVS